MVDDVQHSLTEGSTTRVTSSVLTCKLHGTHGLLLKES